MSKELTMAKALNEGLREKLEENKNVVLLGEDIGKTGGVFRVTKNLLEEFGEDRVMDSPLAESGIVGTCIGMGLNGLRPVGEIQFMGFSYPAFDQIVSHMARYSTRTRGEYRLPLTIRMPYGGGVETPEHHSESTEALYSHYPGLKVVIPSTPHNAKGLLRSSIKDNNPVLFLEPKKQYRSFKEKVPDKSYEIPLGEAEVVSNGEDVTLISWGSMTTTAKNTIKNVDHDVELIDLRTVEPLDESTIVESFKKTGRCVIIQEGPRKASISSELVSVLQEKAFGYHKAPVKRVTGYDIPYPLYRSESDYMPSEKRLRKGINEVMDFEF